MSHSLSPVLHRAAYVALGLPGWSYDRIECDDAALPGLVAGLGPEWVGLSVTMPGKRAALGVAVSVSDAAAAVGAANTLVRVPDGWLADCTDVDGVVGALNGCLDGVLPAPGLTAPGPVRSAVVLGGGGTAAAAVVGLARLGVASVTVVVRSAARAADVLAAAGRVGVGVTVEPWSALATLRADVLVSTVPAGVVDPVAAEAAAVAPAVLDVVYHPWPTPLAHAVAAAGGRLATGLDMLLHQAFGQVTLFTGHPAPRSAMRSALRAAVGDHCPPLPL